MIKLRAVDVDGTAVEKWKRALEDGTASERCDEIVRRVHAEAGIPDRLADAILGPYFGGGWAEAAAA